MHQIQHRQTKWGKRYGPGYNLQEVLLVVSLMAVAASMTIPKITSGFGDRDTGMKRNTSFQEITDTLRLATNDMGTPPMSYGPGQIIAKYAKYRLTDPATVNALDPNFIGVCPTGNTAGAKTYKRIDGVVITNVGTAWSSDADPVTAGSQEGEMVCVALKGAKSQTWGQNAYWLFLPRKIAPGIQGAKALNCASATPLITCGSLL